MKMKKSMKGEIELTEEFYKKFTESVIQIKEIKRDIEEYIMDLYELSESNEQECSASKERLDSFKRKMLDRVNRLAEKMLVIVLELDFNK